MSRPPVRADSFTGVVPIARGANVVGPAGIHHRPRVAASPASPAAPAKPGSVGPAGCPTSALRATLGAAQGTAGSAYQVIVLANVSA